MSRWEAIVRRILCIFGHHEFLVIGTMGTLRFCGICDRWERLIKDGERLVWKRIRMEANPNFRSDRV